MIDNSDAIETRARGRIGQILRDKWRVEGILGIGGMAVVFTATHTNNGRRVAIKMLHPELSMNGELRNRFLREGYVANKISHPGSVAILDDDIAEDGSVFLVLELLEGETIEARRLRKGGVLVPAEIMSICDQVLDTLASAHERGIVHRDVKPDNIFLTKDGGVKLLDFGIARIRELQNRTATLTGAGSMGTPAFMPQEQARGRWDSVGPRTDIWALGATMFTLTTGRCVHEAETLNEVLLAAMTKPAPALATIAPGLPPRFCALVDRALAYEPDERWPDARAMQLALREAYQTISNLGDGPTTDRGIGGAAAERVEQKPVAMPAAAMLTGPRPPQEFAAAAPPPESRSYPQQSDPRRAGPSMPPGAVLPTLASPNASGVGGLPAVAQAPSPMQFASDPSTTSAVVLGAPQPYPMGAPLAAPRGMQSPGPATSSHATAHAVAVRTRAGQRGTVGLGVALAAIVSVCAVGAVGLYAALREGHPTAAAPSAAPTAPAAPTAADTPAPPPADTARAEPPPEPAPEPAAAPSPILPPTAPTEPSATAQAAPATAPAAETARLPKKASDPPAPGTYLPKRRDGVPTAKPASGKSEKDLLNRRN